MTPEADARLLAEARLGRALLEFEAAERAWEGRDRPSPTPAGLRMTLAHDELIAARIALRDMMREMDGEGAGVPASARPEVRP